MTSSEARAVLTAGIDPQIAALSRLDPAKRAVELAFFPVLWACGAFVTSLGFTGPFWQQGLLRAVGIGLTALALNAFVLLLHEGMHGVLFRNRHANRWTSVLLGGCVLVGFTAYRVMHIRHHRYLGDPRDPDDYDNYSSNPRVVWALHFVRLTLGAYLYIVLMPFLAFRHGRHAERVRVVQEYVVLCAAWASVVLFVPLHAVGWYWFFPLILVAAMTNIRGFTQHGIADAHDPFTASRSMHPNPIVSFLLLNENLHLEHHLFPEIPSYHLPAVRRLIEPKLPRAVVGRSYLAFLGRFLKATFRRRSPGVIGLVENSQSDRGAR
jgi:fatty acid desaturase